MKCERRGEASGKSRDSSLSLHSPIDPPPILWGLQSLSASSCHLLFSWHSPFHLFRQLVGEDWVLVSLVMQVRTVIVASH
jgi:hypothetical protein